MSMIKAVSVRFVFTIIAIGASLVAGCDGSPPDERSVSRSIETIADEYVAAFLQRYPEYATWYSVPGSKHDSLFDNSPAALVAWQQREDAWLRELTDIGAPDEIGSRDWVTYGVMLESLESSVGSRMCFQDLWRASSVTAWHSGLPSLFDLQAVGTAEERDSALRRLEQVAAYIDTEITNLRTGLEQGFSTPRAATLAVPAEVRALLGDDNPFTAMGARSGDRDFEAAVEAAYSDDIAPAITRFADFIENEYQANARTEYGVDAHADGLSCYETLVRLHATLSVPADDIHKIGLEQISMIRAEMQDIIDDHFGGGDISTFLKNLNIEPQFTFRTEDEVLQYSLDALGAARDAMPSAFGLMPQANVLIKPYPPHRATGTGEYWASSEDGTRPGVYYIAVVRPENRSRAIQQSVLFHETYPGHHMQVAIALELGDRVHPISRYFYNSGYGEGWGLYSERLADELRLYGGPLDRMGMLSDQAARAARLVVDSGLHAKSWSRQQAVDYMLDNTAWPPGDIESEIDRYMSDPGQATSYMLGMLEILRLRSMAEESLGDAFDLSAFHDRVLETGSMPLPMLDASVRAWIENPE